LAFGADFGVQSHKDQPNLQAKLEEALDVASYTGQVPWTASFFHAFPSLSTSVRDFGAFAMKRASMRASSESRKDLFYHLRFNADLPEDAILPFIAANTILAIIAGSDTTASALSNAIYYLLSNPADLHWLQHEIEQFFPQATDGTTDIDPTMLADMPWLNAVINETLRLQPPVPSGLNRAPAAGSGGKMVGPYFIKEGTSVIVSPYVLHRDPRYFSPDPDRFWPARWLDQNKAKTILDTAAFIPFSQGQANCVGKRLAIFELQYILVLLLGRFNISFSPQWDSDHWEKGLKDRFVLAKDRLMVELKAKC